MYYLLIVGSIKYNRITPIMMRLEVNYPVIATHIMLCLILNYLLIVGSIKYDRITPIIACF